MKFLGFTTFLVAIALLLSGCLAAVRPDPGVVAAGADYPTAEFKANDRLFHGLGEVFLFRGEPLSKIALKVQGYFSGSIRVDSERCHIGQAYGYVENALVDIPIAGNADQSCVIDILVSPDFPGQSGSGVDIYSFKGQLLIRVLNAGEEWYGQSSLVRADTDATLIVPFNYDGPATGVFDGCAYKKVLNVTPANGNAVVYLSKIMDRRLQGRCFFEGAIIAKPLTKRVSWHVWIYAPEFNPLPIPAIEVKGDKVFVTADDAVTAIGLNDKMVLGTKANFGFDKSVANTLRAITVKGRSVVCSWEDNAWKCLN